MFEVSPLANESDHPYNGIGPQVEATAKDLLPLIEKHGMEMIIHVLVEQAHQRATDYLNVREVDRQAAYWFKGYSQMEMHLANAEAVWNMLEP
jgi:hypothetical protein